MSEDTSPFHRVLAYFTGDAHVLAVRALRSYYAPRHHWTGSAFDRLVATTPPDSFTSDDILAVSMLSVNVPPRAALWLIDDREAADLLARIPSDASLWDHPDLLDRDRATWRLWNLIARKKDIGPTIASKVLAAKRPKLIPIHDRYVDAALEFGRSEWGFWQAVAGDDSSSLLAHVEAATTEAEVPAFVSPLRAIDVVVWMRQHGWTMHDPKWDDRNPIRCSAECDFSGFSAV